MLATTVIMARTDLYLCCGAGPSFLLYKPRSGSKAIEREREREREGESVGNYLISSVRFVHVLSVYG